MPTSRLPRAGAQKVNENEALSSAWNLLNVSDDANEAGIRTRLNMLLSSLGVHLDEIREEHKTPEGKGRSDIYIPSLRLFIEIKAPGKASNPHQPQSGHASKTPFQQLSEYVIGEIEKSVRQHILPFASPTERHRAWIGVLTDGQHWHAWSFPHQTNSRGTQSWQPPARLTSARHLVERVRWLVSASRPRKPQVPENPTSIFAQYRDPLTDVWRTLRNDDRRATDTKMALWLDMLKASSMAPPEHEDPRDLFISHSLLVTIVRGVIHTISQPNRDPTPNDILSDGFVAWVVSTQSGRNWAQTVLDTVHEYEWRLGEMDVLRTVYEHFIDEPNRKAFGEYYTPDWLARMLVDEILDADWCDSAAHAALDSLGQDALPNKIGVLDPTCGSGTFLYHAALRLRESSVMNSEPDPIRRADAIARLVCGFDVHPVAVEISRATLLRALPESPSRGQSALRIWQGDALLARQDLGLLSVSPQKGQIRVATPAGGTIFLPYAFASSPNFAADMTAIVKAASTPTGKLPATLSRSRYASELRDAMETMRRVIDTEGNSVWVWFIVNMTGPLLLSERRVDRIVANPPWVRLSDIQVIDRKRALEQLAGKPHLAGKKGGELEGAADLWNGGKNATGFDIAQLFVRRCREQYLSDPSGDPAAWLVNASVIKGRNWTKFRTWHSGHCRQILDFSRLRVRPRLFGVACCALMEHRTSSLYSGAGDHVMVRNRPGTRPLAREGSWDRNRPDVMLVKARARVLRAASDYTKDFRQGATIVPQGLLLLSSVCHSRTRATVTTMGPGGKRPWADLRPLTEDVPTRWVVRLLLGEHVLPFGLRTELDDVLIPVGEDGLLEQAPEATEWFWKKLDDVYNEYRGQGRSTPKTLLARIDYSRGLSSQLPCEALTGIVNSHTLSIGTGRDGTGRDGTGRDGTGRTTVVYPRSGSIMRGARFVRNAVINNTLYYATFDSEEEAAYLVALLNAPCLRQAFRDAKTSALDFHLTPWTAVPIRRFNPDHATHRALVDLTCSAERYSEAWLEKHGMTHGGQIGASKRIREMLCESGIFAEIDKCARELFPVQATPA